MAKKREESYGPRPILIWILVVVLIAVLFFLINSSLFNISSITVVGAQRFSQQDIIGLSGLDYNQNIVQMDEEEVKKSIESDPYLIVKDIKRVFPTMVEIYVTERTPFAQIATVNGYYVIDENAVALCLNQAQDGTLVSIEGMSIAEPIFGSKIVSESDEKTQAAQETLELVKKYDTEQKIKNINVSFPDKVTIIYDGVKVILGKPSEKKFNQLQATVFACKDKLTEKSVINMETEGGYYIENK